MWGLIAGKFMRFFPGLFIICHPKLALTGVGQPGGKVGLESSYSWQGVEGEQVGHTTRERRARCPRPRVHMGGGMEEAATKRAAKGAVRARR